MSDESDARPSRLWLRAGAVWLVLWLALAATVAAAHLDLGGWNLFVALGIAALQAGLVAAIFMDLAGAGAGSRIAMLAALLWVALLISLSFADEATRLHLPSGFATEDR